MKPSHRNTWLERAERPIEQLGVAVSTWVPLAALIAISPGIVAWCLDNEAVAGVHLVENQLPPSAFPALLVKVAVSVLCVLAVYVAVAWRARVVAGVFDHAAMRRLNRRLAAIAAGPFVLVFSVGELEVEHPFFLVLFAGIAAIAVGTSASELGPWLARRRWGRPWTTVAVALVVAMAVAWAIAILRLQLVQHEALRTATFDLGVYTNVMWQSLNGDWLACPFLRGGTHASAHYDPILIALSPILWIHRGAESLLVLQATWLASGAIPVFLLARRHGGRAFGVALACTYLLHPALQGVSLFDFHSLSLSVPFVLWAVWCLEEKRWWAYAIVLAGWLSCREDMALEASCLGLYAIAVHRETRVGVLTIATAGLWLAYVKLYEMPDPQLLMTASDEAYGYRSFYRGLDPQGIGVSGILRTLVTNPSYVLQSVFVEERLLYLGQLLLPLALLPLLAGRRWVLLAYASLIVVFSSHPPMYRVGFHYASAVLPGIFAVTPPIAAAVVARLEKDRGIAPARSWAFLGAAMVVGALLMTESFGAFVPNEHFVAGLFPLRRELTEEDEARIAWLRETTRDIPPDAPLSASGDLLPHFATRQRIYRMPSYDEADWVVSSALNGKRAHVGVAPLRRAGDTWELVDEAHGIVVFRRRSPAP